MNQSEVDDSKPNDQQPPPKKLGLFKNILNKHLNRFKGKKEETKEKDETSEKEEQEEDLEDEELDLICAYPEEDLNNQKDSESVKDKLTKGVKFKFQDSDSQSIVSGKESIKSTFKFDDFGLEESEVISLEKFDVVQNEIIQDNQEMSKRPTNVKATKTSSVNSKASSSSKTSSSGSNSRSVSKSRAGGKSPQPPAQTKTKSDNKTESKDVNNNLISTPAKAQKKELDKPKVDDDASASKTTSPTPLDQQTASSDNQVPSKPIELDPELMLDTSQANDQVSKSKPTTGKSIKRKPSTQHRNSKQDTAQLLRRKSLTPSAKLIILCKKGDWLAVETFLKQVDKKTIDTSVVNEENNWTPLMYAARDNRVAIVERLLQLGFNVNARADEDITALHVACSNAREDTIKLLLMKRIDTMVPAGPKKQLALHILSSKPTGAAVVPVQLLLKGSPRECRLFKDADQNIPLIYAVEVGNHGLAKELLTDFQKEQLEARKNGNGDGAIHISAKRKDLEQMKTLIERGCNINMKNKEGLTILHIAAMHNDESMVRYLGGLEGLNPDIQDRRDRTALHIATEKGNTRMMDYLVDKCKASLTHRTKAGSTVMHLVCKNCSKETVMQYMKKGVPLLMSDKNGIKLLHMAAMAGHYDIVRITLQRGEKVDVATKEGYTALHLATENRQDQVIELLLGNGASINAKTAKEGSTSLHLAAKTSDCLKCVSMLISSGARINETQNNGDTALHVSARCGFQDTFDRLIEEGAKPELLNNDGENVLHISVKECHFSIVNKIINYVRKKKPTVPKPPNGINNIEQTPATDESDPVKDLVNQQNKNKESCVHLAAAILKSKEHYENEISDIMQLLLKCGGDITLTNDKNETCVHYAAKFGGLEQLKKVIEHLPESKAQAACNALAQNSWSPLFYACKNGHSEIIKLLLEQNARVDIFDASGTAGLHLAAELGHQDVCTVLLENNAFVNVRNKLGMTPLHLAAESGYVDLCRNLVEKHEALIDAMTLTKQTPLHLAAKSGQIETCKVLLQLNADLNAVDNEQQTALHLAADNNHSNVVRLFLEKRPELISMPNKQGLTVAHIASTKGSVDVLQELKNFNLEAVKFSVIKKQDSTSLHLAAERGYDKVVKFLLEAGANPAKEDRAGMTSLHLAAKFGHLKVLTALNNYIDFKICSRKTGLTALHVAAKNGQTDFVSEMLDKVPGSIKSQRYALNPNADFGFTPLHLAAQFGHEGPVRLLMNSTGVKVDAASEINGIIPFHLAAQGGHEIVANLLISRSSESLYQTDKFGRTCVHLAASRGRLDMIRLLIGQGAHYDSVDNKKWTPLIFASKNGFLDCVKLLVESGANPLAETEDGKTAICFAVASNHYPVFSYLLTREHDSMNLLKDNIFLIDLMQCSKTNEYKPLEEFILKSETPIEIAVKLARCYDDLAEKEKQMGKDLEGARDVCDQIAIKLISVVAIVSDAGKLLRSIDSKRTELLDCLIELERKDVVSQHAVQTYLSEVWFGHLTSYSTRRWMFLMISFVLCPLIWIYYSFPFKFNQYSKVPIIKFMAYFTSHLYLILILTVTTIYPSVKFYEYTTCFPTWYEWLLYIWLLGILVNEIISPSDKSGLGAIRNVIIFLGFLAIVVHLGAFILNNAYYSSNSYEWKTLKLDVFYLRNQILGLVLLLSFVELLNYLTFHPLFGPWGVIIIEILIDLVRFLVVLLIFLFGFTLHISSIYIAVYGPKKDLGIPYDFENIGQSFEMLFFALFGIVAHDFLPAKNYSPSFAKLLMKIIFGIYMTLVMIVLMNLLIAMMSNTYQRIDERSDIEWKYGRAKLIRNMTRMISTPPPLNLFIGIGHQYYVKFTTQYEKNKKIKQQFAKITLANLKLPPPAISAGRKWLHKTAHKRAAIRNKSLSPNKQKEAMALEEVKFISEVVDWNFIVESYKAYGGVNLKSSTQKEEHNKHPNKF